MAIFKKLKLKKLLSGSSNFNNNSSQTAKHLDNDNLNKGLTNYKNIREESKLKYDANLITHLEEKHKEIIDSYQKIHFFYQENQFNNIIPQLSLVKHLFKDYTLTRNVKFYAHLKNQLNQLNQLNENSQENNFLFQSRCKMNNLSKYLIQFIDRWSQSNFDHMENLQIFLDEYKDIENKMLTQFIYDEENILPLYEEYIKT